jgi:hypothetical protein
MRPPASGVLAVALRPAVGGGVLRPLPDGFPALPLPPAAGCSPQPLGSQGSRCHCVAGDQWPEPADPLRID